MTDIGDIHHIGYLVKSIDRSMKSFMALGFSVESEKVFDNDRHANICFLKMNGQRVELVEPTKDSDIFPLLKKYPNQIYHVCYKVKDINKAVFGLCKEGTGFLQFKEKQRATAISDSAVVVFLMHSGMGMIELLEENKEVSP